MKIQEWPKDERPREKLIHYGASTLSDAELLAILINTGTQGQSAVELAKQALNEIGSIQAVMHAPPKQITKIAGLGLAKYAVLQACTELFKRSMAEQLAQQASFTSADAASEYLRVQLAQKKREVFAMLLLNSQHQLIAYREMFMGTINSAAVYPRELVKQVIDDNAAAVILAHNHPSGVAEPSQADIQITQRIQQAFALIDVTVLDHFVIGRSSAVSFAQRGLL
ncbi:RadC family protein [Glaciecola petra]|uniref:DNA repair protein RadC n=1 Tax=Glaciecola petra TaxID=3075602 RepID=A0ABU2ZUW0_9ALTE|nr:DNA repair protein RadC [Aestuariibacter sp. P117]MDT0596429.1 DNA repair protein RadC [Aestuariibacter sp. P117]